MSRRTRVSVGVAATAAAFGALLIPAMAQAAVTPTATLTVSPSTNLSDGDTVAVSGSGYTANSTVYISECSSLAGDPAACNQDLSKVVTAQADASGSFSGAQVVVHTGQVGNGTCPSPDPNDSCGLAATDNPLDPTSGHFGGAPIVFKNTVQVSKRSGLTNGEVVQVSGLELPPSTALYILECAPDADAQGNGCDQQAGRVGQALTDAQGNLPATAFTVYTGQMDPNDPNSKCVAGGSPCAIAVVQQSPLQPLGTVLVTFAAPPPPSTTTVATSVSIKSTKKSVSTGQRFAVKGRASAGGAGVNGLVAKLYQRANAKHKWAKVASKTTATIKGVAGSYKFALKGLKHSEQYQVRTVKKQIGHVIYKAGVSKTVTVK